METEKRRTLAATPLGTDCTITVQVVLWDRERERVCLVLDQGGVKERDGGAYEKPRGWGNVAGKVRVAETPYEAAVRETEEETNHMRKTFRVGRIPFEVRTTFGTRERRTKTHHKIVFVAEMVDPKEPLESIDVCDPAGGRGGGILKRAWVPYAELPDALEAKEPSFRFRDESLYTSHLSFIFVSRNEAL